MDESFQDFGLPDLWTTRENLLPPLARYFEMECDLEEVVNTFCDFGRHGSVFALALVHWTAKPLADWLGRPPMTVLAIQGGVPAWSQKADPISHGLVSLSVDPRRRVEILTGLAQHYDGHPEEERAFVRQMLERVSFTVRTSALLTSHGQEEVWASLETGVRAL